MKKNNYWKLFSTAAYCISSFLILLVIIAFVSLNKAGFRTGDMWLFLVLLLPVVLFISAIYIRKNQLWAKYVGVLCIVVLLSLLFLQFLQ
jgi:hypothetical protein